jgi:hypothetical protein
MGTVMGVESVIVVKEEAKLVVRVMLEVEVVAPVTIALGWKGEVPTFHSCTVRVPV